MYQFVGLGTSINCCITWIKPKGASMTFQARRATAGIMLWDVCRPGKDFRFALLRHWSLYEAMLHSPHVAVRMQTWADKGRRRLEELLAKMGFRIKDCKLDFCEPHPLLPLFCRRESKALGIRTACYTLAKRVTAKRIHGIFYQNTALH